MSTSAASDQTAPDDAVCALLDLVTVQPGSVVSRMLLKNKSGSATLFGFGAGEGLSEHTAPCDALVVGVAGQATVTIDGTAHTVRAGDVLQLPASIPHAVHAATDFKMLLFMLRA